MRRTSSGKITVRPVSSTMVRLAACATPQSASAARNSARTRHAAGGLPVHPVSRLMDMCNIISPIKKPHKKSGARSRTLSREECPQQTAWQGILTSGCAAAHVRRKKHSAETRCRLQWRDRGRFSRPSPCPSRLIFHCECRTGRTRCQSLKGFPLPWPRPCLRIRKGWPARAFRPLCHRRGAIHGAELW